MVAHVYRKGESDNEGLHEETTRVTVFEDGRRYDHQGPVLVLGTLPNLTVLPMSDVRWFWVEES